jgi:hypothetical protein
VGRQTRRVWGDALGRLRGTMTDEVEFEQVRTWWPLTELAQQ